MKAVVLKVLPPGAPEGKPLPPLEHLFSAADPLRVVRSVSISIESLERPECLADQLAGSDIVIICYADCAGSFAERRTMRIQTETFLDGNFAIVACTSR